MLGDAVALGAVWTSAGDDDAAAQLRRVSDHGELAESHANQCCLARGNEAGGAYDARRVMPQRGNGECTCLLHACVQT